MIAIVPSRRAAAILSVLPVATFALGAWCQDVRMRDHYREQGYTAATHDAIMDGYWLYLGCLSDDCQHEHRASDWIVRRGEERLRTGKFVPSTVGKDTFRDLTPPPHLTDLENEDG